MQNIPTEILRYKYIHIWSMPGEARIKATDPAVIDMLVTAILKTYPNAQINMEADLTEQVHFVKITQMEPEERHHQICWWMFKMLCARGWEPMEVTKRDYKLKYTENAD